MVVKSLNNCLKPIWLLCCLSVATAGYGGGNEFRFAVPADWRVEAINVVDNNYQLFLTFANDQAKKSRVIILDSSKLELRTCIDLDGFRVTQGIYLPDKWKLMGFASKMRVLLYDTRSQSHFLFPTYGAISPQVLVLHRPKEQTLFYHLDDIPGEQVPPYVPRAVVFRSIEDGRLQSFVKLPPLTSAFCAVHDGKYVLVESDCKLCVINSNSSKIVDSIPIYPGSRNFFLSGEENRVGFIVPSSDKRNKSKVSGLIVFGVTKQGKLVKQRLIAPEGGISAFGLHTLFVERYVCCFGKKDGVGQLYIVDVRSGRIVFHTECVYDLLDTICLATEQSFAWITHDLLRSYVTMRRFR